MARLFLHVGYPKTATTTLQRHLFPHHPDLFFVGRPFSEELWAVEQDMLTAERASFEERLPLHRRRFVNAITGVEEQPILLSHEGFLRSTRHGGHDVRRTAKRVHQVFAGALAGQAEIRAIVVIRNQVDLFLSHFVQFVGGFQRELDAYVHRILNQARDPFVSSLFYDQVLERYADLFGRENVVVLVFEDFVRDSEAFILRLSNLLGIDGSTSLAYMQGRHERWQPRRKTSYLVPDKAAGAYTAHKVLRRTGARGLARTAWMKSAYPVALSEAQRRQIADLYRNSNSALQETYGLQLDRLGYPTLDSRAT